MNKNEVIEYLVTKIEDEQEPLFLLRGRDPLSYNVIGLWCEQADKVGVPEEKIKGARRVQDEIRRYSIAKIPD